MEQRQKSHLRLRLRKVCKTINQEGNNTLSRLNLLENNQKSLIDTIGKIVKEEFNEHETKMSEMISNNLQNTNDCLDKISKEMTKLTKSLEFTQEQLEGDKTILRKTLNIWKQLLKESTMIVWTQMKYPQN